MAETKKTKPKYLVLGVNYKERKNNPPPGLHWHKVGGKGNSTLGEIADQFNIRPIDLMLYNWHTINGFEVNWYLYHHVGARREEKGTYGFELNNNPGMLLVPNIPPSIQKGPPQSVSVVRNGDATLDNKIRVFVSEWLATGEKISVSGKWLYVFSGGGGVDFGYDSGPLTINSTVGGGEFKVPDDAKPGTAFTPDFTGVFHIAAKADKLEYEILITSENAPSTELQIAASGFKDSAEPHYKVGNNWHFLSDPTILKNWATDSRDKRTTHAFRGSKHNDLVEIDLTKNRRYYFLLSPVQLGPAALKYAMANPKGLTPLLKPGENTRQWDPSGSSSPSITTYVGPTAADIEKGLIKIDVIDPYAWAEDIVQQVHADDIKQYVDWVSSSHNATLEELKKDTGWTLKEYELAQILKSVRDSHSKSAAGDIDKELKDAKKWKSDLVSWEQKLFLKNAEINANAHRSLIQLIDWLEGPGHGIIETAILKDATADSPQDAIDVAHGIVHWAVCTEYMMALEPGVIYLRDVLNRPGAVPNDVVLKHFKDLDKYRSLDKLPKTHEIAFRYGYQGVFMLMGLQHFVSDPPPIPKTLDRQQYLLKLAEYHHKRREGIIEFFNQYKILPVKLQAPPSLPSPPSQAGAWSTGSAAFNSFLDIGDKFATYVIDTNMSIPKGDPGTRYGRFLNLLGSWEEKIAAKGKLGSRITTSSNWTLKGVSFGISFYNLRETILTARYDYQHTVKVTDWLSVASGVAIAVQDVLVGVIALTKNARLERIFPSLTTAVKGGRAWSATTITGVAGRVFAGVNVLAMFVSGVMTMVSMGQSLLTARDHGDYTAAAFYTVGFLGGAVMVGGALVLGYGLMATGAATAWTGIGVVIFAVGAIVAAVAALGAWLFSSTDYEKFARKCFLGDDGNIDGTSPWGGSPPDWSHAANNSWTIENQKRAILNLIGRFKVETKPLKTFERDKVYTDSILVAITPGLVIQGSTIEVALHYGDSGTQMAAIMKWNKFNEGKLQLYSAKPLGIINGSLFDADDTVASFDYTGENLKKIRIYPSKLTYDGGQGSLVTTVTIRYPGEYNNVISCRKLVMKHGSVYGETVDDDETTSDIYV